MTIQTAEQTEKQTIPFSKLLPNFKKFLPKKSNIYYEKTKDIHNNGEYLEATDSHTVFRIKQDMVSDHNIAFTEKYPNLDRLIPTEFNHEININYDEIKTLLSSLRELKPFTKGIKNNVVRLTFTDEKLYMVVKYTSKETNAVITETRVINVDYNNSEPFKIAVNINYLIDILVALKKVISNMSDVPDVKVGLIATLRPIVFTIEDVCLFELFPVRVFPGA